MDECECAIRMERDDELRGRFGIRDKPFDERIRGKQREADERDSVDASSDAR